jgi:hypothetical protein
MSIFGVAMSISWEGRFRLRDSGYLATGRELLEPGGALTNGRRTGLLFEESPPP